MNLTASMLRARGREEGQYRERAERGAEADARCAQEADLVLYPRVDLGELALARAHLVADPALQRERERERESASRLFSTATRLERSRAHLFEVEVEPDAGLGARDLLAQLLLEALDVAKEALVLGLEVHEVGALRQLEVLLEGGKVNLRGGFAGQLGDLGGCRGSERAHLLPVVVLRAGRTRWRRQVAGTESGA